MPTHFTLLFRLPFWMTVGLSGLSGCLLEEIRVNFGQFAQVLRKISDIGQILRGGQNRLGFLATSLPQLSLQHLHTISSYPFLALKRSITNVSEKILRRHTYFGQWILVEAPLRSVCDRFRSCSRNKLFQALRIPSLYYNMFYKDNYFLLYRCIRL